MLQSFGFTNECRPCSAGNINQFHNLCAIICGFDFEYFDIGRCDDKYDVGQIRSESVAYFEFRMHAIFDMYVGLYVNFYVGL